MDHQMVFMVIVFVLAFTYAWGNGSNDCANTQATIIATKALPSKIALALGGVMNAFGLVAAWLLGSAIVNTLGNGVIKQELITEAVILSGLIGAIALTWFATVKGIPISVTHSLIGGIFGAGVAHGGFTAIAGNNSMILIVIGIFLAPLLGFVLGYFMFYTIRAIDFFLERYAERVAINRFWCNAQIFSSSWLAFSHGMNDGQNALSVIAIAAISSGMTKILMVDWWMVIPIAIAIGGGTIFHGAKVIKTVGEEITTLEPIDGFAAQSAMALLLTVKALLGIPASTTHIAVSSIVGVGGAKDLDNTNWGISRHIGMAWLITIPAAGIVGALTHFFFTLFL